MNRNQTEESIAEALCVPCMNCAAEVCCPPPDALAAKKSILCALGMSESEAEDAADVMKKYGVAFAPQSLMDEIAKFADHPNRKHNNTPDPDARR